MRPAAGHDGHRRVQRAVRDHARAVATADLCLEHDIVLGSEWDERSYEHHQPTPHALRVARLRRDPDRYIAMFGRAAYDIMLGDALWHVYALIGKLAGRVLVLTKPPGN